MRRTGIVAIALIACAAPATADELTDAMAKASAGHLTALQMSDGTKQWRFASRQIKGEDAQMRLTDLIAQGLARSQWCPNGWEETKRTEMSGMLVIEGRCK